MDIVTLRLNYTFRSMIRELDILFEDNHLLGINKPCGILVQGDITGDKPLIDVAKDYVAKKYNKPGAVFLGLVHRLDRPVSGVIMFARTSKSLDRMNALFRDRKTSKVYWAIVSTKPPRDEDTLIHWLVKDEKKNKTVAYKKEHKDGLRSELTYKIIERLASGFLLEVR